MRNFNDLTLTLDWMVATADFGLVCAQQAKGCYSSSLQSAQAFMGAIPGVFKFLRYSKLYIQSKGLSAVALAALDVVGDESVAIMQLAMPAVSARAVAQA